MYDYSPGAITGSGNPFSDLDLPTGDGGFGRIGSYNLVYPHGIQIYGASFSTYLADSNIAGEFSMRRRMPLVSNALIVGPEQTGDAKTQPLHAVGSSLHAQVSTISSFSSNSVWDTADLSAEIAVNHRLKVSRNRSALNTDRDKFAAAIRVVFEPRYFEVRPGLTLSVPLGVGYGIAGNSSVDGSQNERTGDVEFGLRAIYRSVWTGELTFTHFLGSPERQFFADRDILSLSVRRTF